MKHGKKMSASKRALHMMADGGGLKAYMNGGSPVDALVKAQKGMETEESMNSEAGRQRMADFSYPNDLGTRRDSLAYKAGYANDRSLTGMGVPGITQNKNYRRGAKASQRNRKKK